MKVLHVTSGYPSGPLPVSGTFVRQQVRALAEHGVSVSVVHLIPCAPRPLGIFSEKWRQFSLIRRGEERDGCVTVYRTPYLAFPREVRWGYPDKLMAAAVLRFLRKHALEFDLIHGHHVFPAGAAAQLVGARLQVPVVLTAHGSDVNFYPTYNTRARRRFVSVVRSADRVVTVSRALEGRVYELAGASAVTLPIGVDPTLFSSPINREQLQEQLGLYPGRRYLLFVGGLLRQKGVYDLVGAFASIAASFPDVDLLLVGAGPEQAGLQRTVEQGNLGDRVRFVGPVSHGSVAAWMSASEVLVLPSYSEGLPTVVVEAGALALPVVATRVGGIPQVIEDGVSGELVEPGDQQQLCGVLARVLSCPGETVRMGQALQKVIHRDYDLRTNANKLLCIYQDVLRDRVGARVHPSGATKITVRHV